MTSISQTPSIEKGLGQILKARFSQKQPEIWAQAFKLSKILTWMLGFSIIANILLILLCAVLAGQPADVIFIDNVGKATFFPKTASSEPPSSPEIDDFAKVFANNFLSRDSVTASRDLASALSVMHRDLQNTFRIQYNKEFFDKLNLARIRSVTDQMTVKILERVDNKCLIEITGQRQLISMADNFQQIIEPFSLKLFIKQTKRTQVSPHGLMVMHINGKVGDEAILEEVK